MTRPRFAALIAAIIVTMTLAWATPTHATTTLTPATAPGPGEWVLASETAPAGEVTVGSATVCTTASTDSSALPVNRWANASSEFHSRLGGMIWQDATEKIFRKVFTESLYALGNTLWSTTTSMTEAAVNMCLLESVGHRIDTAAAKIATAIWTSGLLMFIVVVSIIALALRARREGSAAAFKGLGHKVIVMSVFGFMLIGASNSTGEETNYVPGTGSPGWFVTTIDKVISAAASSTASTLAESDILNAAETGYDDPKVTGTDYLGCPTYVWAMKELYREKHGAPGPLAANAVTPLVISNLWEQSGLEMWKSAQFGRDNEFASLMYCRLLERRANAPRKADEVYRGDSTSVHDIMVKAASVSGKAKPTYVLPGTSTPVDVVVDGDHLAFRYTSNPKRLDRALVGWAACLAGPSGEKAAGVDGRKLLHVDNGAGTTEALAKQCNNLFDNSNVKDDGELWDGGNDKGEFDWGDSDGDILAAGTSKQAEDFVLTMHGNKAADGLLSAIIYAVSAVAVTAVFATFSLAIMLGKIAALTMMLLAFLVLTISVASKDSSKAVNYAKQYIGISLFVFFSQLLLSMIALLSSVLVLAGNDVMPGGQGGAMSLLWVGCAPALAALCMHMAFKKAGIPSPLTPGGAMSWGKAASNGTMASAASDGTSAIARAMRRQMRRQSAGSVGRWMRGRRNSSAESTGERKSRMDPKSEEETPTPTGENPGEGSGEGSGENTEDKDTEENDAEENDDWDTDPEPKPKPEPKSRQDEAKEHTAKEKQKNAERSRKLEDKYQAKERRDAERARVLAFAKSGQAWRSMGRDLRRRTKASAGLAKDRAAAAALQFAKRPFHTTGHALKTGVKAGAKAGAIGSGMLIASAATGVALPLVAAGLYGAHRFKTRNVERPKVSLNPLSGSHTLFFDAYRRHRKRTDPPEPMGNGETV